MSTTVEVPKHTQKVRSTNITDSMGVPLELYELILEPKRQKLAELLTQVAYLQAEVQQLEETLKDRIDGTRYYYDTYMQI